MRTHSARDESSNPSCATVKMPLARKAKGNNPIWSTFLRNSEPYLFFLLRLKSSMLCSQFQEIHFPRNTQSPVSGFCYARNRACFAVDFKKYTSVEKTQSPVSGFCYARNRVCFAVNFKKYTSL